MKIVENQQKIAKNGEKYMNTSEQLSFVSYFLELLSALKFKVSFKEYLSDRKMTEQIDKKTDNIFYKVMDFAKNRPKNSIIRVNNSLEDELIIPLEIYQQASYENCTSNSNFTIDGFVGATANVLKMRKNELNWDMYDDLGVGISFQPSEFYAMLHVFVRILFDCHQKDGLLISSSPDEQGLEIVRKKKNDSSKIERNATARKKIQENSSNDKQNTLKVRDDTNDLSKDKTKRDPKWTKAVLQRDNYTCQCCGYDKKKHLEVHHIYSFRDNEAYRTQVDNGITLCKFCHKKYHSEFGRDGANPYELMLFFKKYATK